MSSEFSSSAKEFPAWGPEMKVYCQSLLHSLPLFREMDNYVEEQGLTHSFASYQWVEGNLSQMLQMIGQWSQIADRFYKRLTKRADAFTNFYFRVSYSESMLQIEPVLSFVLPQSSSDGLHPEEYRLDQVSKGEVFPFIPVVCLVARVASSRYRAYAPFQEGFDRLFGRVTGDFPTNTPKYEFYHTADWHQIVNRIPAWINNLLTVRGTDYDIHWGGFGKPDDYVVLERESQGVVEELVHWLSLAEYYAQKALAATRGWHTAVKYSARLLRYSLGVNVNLEYMSDVYGKGHNNNGMCEIFRVSKHRYQIILHTESYFRRQEREWSASIEEHIKAGYNVEITHNLVFPKRRQAKQVVAFLKDQGLFTEFEQVGEYWVVYVAHTVPLDEDLSVSESFKALLEMLDETASTYGGDYIGQWGDIWDTE